jgi:branched-chain amino acid aminotransferase
VAIAAWSWPSYFSKDKHERGLKLTISDWARPAPNTAPTASKAAGLYMICTISKHAAEKEGYDDALMLDYRGYIAEATGANIFFIKDGEIHTPDPDCFLDGITRRTVMEVARSKGITIHERHIKPEELADFESAFLTGTAAEVTPIGQIGEHEYVISPLVKELMDTYQQVVRT